VGGLAGEDREMALYAAGAEHGCGRLSLALEHGPLLDVHLQVRARAAELGAGLVRAIELHVVARDHVLEPLAVAVAEVANLVRVERAGARRRAEQAAPEARTLLVGPVHEPEADRRLPVPAVRPERLDGREHAERAVEPAPGGHGVDVRADDHEPLLLSGDVGPQVARGVDGQLGGQLVKPRAQELARLGPLIRPADAPRPVRPAGQAGQLAKVLEDAIGVHDATGAAARSERGTKRP
jgi:hypothetical protein